MIGGDRWPSSRRRSTSPWPPTARRASGRSQELARRRRSPTSTRLADALRRFPGDGGALGWSSVDEDFFLLVRVAGADVRLLLSDVTAADEWELAALGRRAPRPARCPRTRTTRCRPATSASLGDLGMHAMDMGALLDDFDLYPDEMLSDIAGRLGFGQLFDDARRRSPPP